MVSGYDLDTGSAALNLLYRDPELGDLSYLASLSDGEASRVISLSARLDRGALLIISGGHRVKIWSSLAESGQDQENVIRAQTRTLVCRSGVTRLTTSWGGTTSSPPLSPYLD